MPRLLLPRFVTVPALATSCQTILSASSLLQCPTMLRPYLRCVIRFENPSSISEFPALSRCFSLRATLSFTTNLTNLTHRVTVSRRILASYMHAHASITGSRRNFVALYTSNVLRYVYEEPEFRWVLLARVTNEAEKKTLTERRHVNAKTVTREMFCTCVF